MRKIIITIIAIIITVGAASGVYVWQHKKVHDLQKQQTVLSQGVSSLQGEYSTAKAAAIISTTGWKQFCDQFSPFCFSYPANWVLHDSPFRMPGDNRDAATVTNPAKTINIDYANPLIKDGGSFSARIVKVNKFSVDGTEVAILGIIPVSSGIYSPMYITLNTDQALSATPSDKTVLVSGSINARFDIGMHDAILFTGGPTTNISSYAQAKAWFDSVDGNTTLKVLESFSAQ